MDTKNIRIELKEDIRAENPAVGWLYDTLEQALDEIDRQAEEIEQLKIYLNQYSQRIKID